MSLFTSKIVLNEAYDEISGLYQHRNEQMSKVKINGEIVSVPSHPLAVVSKHPGEQVYDSHSKLYKTMDLFVKKKIGNTLGISLLEFLDLPIHITDMLLKIADTQQTLEHKLQTEHRAEIDRSMNKK